ncbi:YfiR family protein [Desulfosarcina sp.]|uniref:YfiR family protein n=1 Tax=Desulfosarcina sp. TaxID=2027861 RepID=UPI0035617B51
MLNWSSIKRFTKHKAACILGLVAGFLLLCQGSLLAGSASAASVEYRVKAAFLYNFTKFIEWPAHGGEKGRPFTIGILGEDPFGSEMEALAGKAVGDESLKVQRFPAWNDRAQKCDILFISGSEEKNLPEILRRLDGSPVLTVGDAATYARRGVIINFFMEDNKVRFEINLKQAKRAGLKISSRLLKLAVILEDSAG